MNKLHRTLAAGGAALLLGMCSAIAQETKTAEKPNPGIPNVAGPTKYNRPSIKTVKPRTYSDTPTTETGLSTGKEIFDFHPRGSAADSWRQPFDIDVNDGPLKDDIRRSNEELKAYHAGLTKPGASRTVERCGERDVATGRAGCASRSPAKSRTATPDPADVQ